MAKVINCECGTVVQGATDAELLRRANDHIREAHPELVGEGVGLRPTGDGGGGVSVVTETETLVERFIEELPNRGNLDAGDDLFAWDFIWHVPYSAELSGGRRR
jgi:uncharacterized protein DUF1059